MRRTNNNRVLDILNHQLDEIEKEAESKGLYLHLRAPFVRVFTLRHAAVLYEIMFKCNNKADGYASVPLAFLDSDAGLGKHEIRRVLNDLLQTHMIEQRSTGRPGKGSEYSVNVEKVLAQIKNGTRMRFGRRKQPSGKLKVEPSGIVDRGSSNIFAPHEKSTAIIALPATLCPTGTKEEPAKTSDFGLCPTGTMLCPYRTH